MASLTGPGPARPDPYRVLGVLPDADEAVIRAAYLALMKRYHPDQPGADAERAKAIAAAYRQLADPQRRVEWDRGRREQQVARRVADPLPRPGRKTGRTAFFALSLLAAGLLYVAVSRPAPDLPGLLGGGGSASRDLPRQEPPVLAAREEEEELAELPAASAVPSPPVPQPMRGAEAAAAAPRPSPSPSLASRTLPPEPDPPAAGPEQPPAPVARVQLSEPVKPTAEPVPAIDLAALERHQLLFYKQSYLAGDDRRRLQLMESRREFVRRLGSCGDDPCRRDVYLARNQEIAEIMRR